MEQKECEHKWVHFDTRLRKETGHFGAPEWFRLDLFFCEKCLEEETKKRYDQNWMKPEWY